MTAPDGPWRVADRIRLVVEGGAPGPAQAGLADTLQALGLAVLDIRADGALSLPPQLGDGDLDLLVLDPETVIAPDAVAALRRVVDGDPMLAAASPRMLRPAEPDLPPGAWPRATEYAVLPDRRCLYVKGSVLRTFPMASGGPVDTLFALNRFGFRVALAGHAVARHPAGDRPAEPMAVPAAWRPALARHRASAPATADRLLQALRPQPDGKLAIAFDLSALGAGHSGTTRLAAALIRRAALRWPDVALHAIADEAAFAAHLDGIGDAVARVDPADPRTFAAVIRFGQPFLWGEVDGFARRAPVLVVVLLDTIGLDCLVHAPDELDALWRFVCAEADGLLFNSAFTERQFGRRFVFRPGLPRRASLHSLDLADYRDGPAADDPPADVGVLVVGNRFPHKHLRETASVLARAGLAGPINVLGLEPGAVAGVTSLPSGGLSPARLAALHAAAAVVVYPSVYEGFGFPILEALAHRRPILVRDLPPYAEIAAALPEAANIHAYADDADLVRRLADPPAWTNARRDVAARNWDDAVDDLRAVLDAALGGVDRDRVVRRIDVLRGRMSYMRGRALAGEGGSEALDRLAGAAGRAGQRLAMALGRRVPTALLDRLARAFGSGR